MKKILQYFVAILTFTTYSMHGSTAAYSLINNYTSDATNCIFYYSNSPSVNVGTIAGNGGSFAGISSTNYAIQCNYSALGQTGMIIPIIPTSNVNMFGYGGGIYNNSNAPIYVWYKGMVNYPTTGNYFQSLTANNPIAIAPGTAVPIITGTTQITGYSTNSNPSITSMTPLFTISDASATNTYYIDANYQYSTSVAMTNNYNTSASVSVNSIATGSVTAAGSYTIPSGTNTLQASFGTSSFVYFTPSTVGSNNSFTNNFNIFTNYNLCNNTPTTLYLYFFNATTGSTDTARWILPGYTSMLIPTGAQTLWSQDSFTNPTVTYFSNETVTNSSYIINNNSTWTVDAYTPTLLNNGDFTANNLSFNDINGATISWGLFVNSDSTITIPGNAVATAMYNQDLASNIYLPIIFPYPAIFSQNNLGQLYTISNSTNDTIYINYFGTVNSVTSTPLNFASSSPYLGIVVEPGATTPIIASALNISISSESGSAPITLSPFTQGVENDYYVYDTGTELIFTPNNVQLTNNYSQVTGNITFTGGTTTTLSGLQPWQSTATIPTGSTTASFAQSFNGQSATLTIPVSDTVSSNIFENYCLYNNYNLSIYVIFWNNSNQLNTPAILVGANQSIPIINNTTSISISTDGLSYQQTPLGSNATSYYVDTQLTLNPYTPMLTNNYSGQNASNFQFLQSNGGVITTDPVTPSTFESGATIPVPATSTAMSFSDYNGTLLTVPTFLSPTSNLFLPTTVTNSAGQTVNLSFFGPITYQSYNNTQAQFNTTTMALGANNWIYLPTGTTSISATNPNNTSLASPVTNITSASSFFINQETTSSQLTINTTVDLSTTSLTNNLTIPASQNANQLIFYNSNNVALPTTQNSTLAASESIMIPDSAYYATFEQTFTADNSPVTTQLAIPAYLNNQPQYLYTPYTINNLTPETIYLTFYTSVQLNTQAIPVAAGTSLQILTGAQYVSITANGFSGISQQSLLTNSSTVSSSWYVTTNGSQLVLQNTIPATSYNLTNNYNYNNQSAQVTFYDINNNTIGSASIDSFASTPIIDTTATIKLNDLGTTQIVLPVLDSSSSSLFSNAFINNNTGQSIGISYWYTANSQQVPCNSASNLINLADDSSSPIFTQASQFAIYNNSGIIQTTQPITTNTSYVINSDWSITQISTGIALTNNTGQTANLVTFYDTGNQVGNVTSPENGTPTPIPAGATKATFENINQQNQTVTLSIPIIDTNSSIIVETDGSNNPYTITNNSGQPITINYFGTLDTVPSSPMNSSPLPVNPGTSINILNGISQSVTVLYNSTPVMTLEPISTGNNYYIYLEGSDWIMTNYAATNTITNNGTAAATTVQCMPSTGSTPLATIASLPSNQPFPIPTNTAYVTLYDADLASNLLLPIAGTANNTILAPNSFITNNAASSIHLTYQGTVNNGISGLQDLNNTPIAVTPGQPTQIVTGAQYVILQENSTTYQIQNGVSYYITQINGVWNLNTYNSSALLFNNFNTALTNVTFNNISPNTPQSVAANGSVAVPSTSNLITFTDFGTSTTTPPGTIFAVPVSPTQSSSLFSSSVLTNTSNLDVQIFAFGAGGTPLNTTGATLPGTAPNNYVNIFNALESFQVWYNGTEVIDTATMYAPNPLPLTQSYNIVYDGSWSLVPTTTGTLFNNYNENATSITYYNSTGGTVPSISNTMLPWATNAAPSTAYYAQIQYPSGTLTTILNPATASATVTGKVFTNSLLINNSDVDVYVTFYGNLPNLSQIQLNNSQILLEAGNAFPFITGTNAITLNNISGQAILTKYPINSNQFWEIGYSLTTRSWSIEEKSALRAAASNIDQSSSALGVLRFLGGQAPTTSTTPSVALYGTNAQLFEQYLYIDTYAQCITDPIAQAAAKDQVHNIVYNYAINYRQQPNFNYISYFYLIQDQLDAAQTDLTAQYTSSTTQINQFFDYLKLRVAALL